MRIKSSRRYIGFAAGVGLIVIVLSATTAVPASAQSGILSILAGLQSSLNAIQESLSAHSAADDVNTLFTGPVHFNGNTWCLALNATEAPRTIHVELLDSLNGEIMFEHFHTVSPGRSTGLNAGGGNQVLFGYCKFTVVDGKKSDVRAVVVRFGEGAFALAAE